MQVKLFFKQLLSALGTYMIAFTMVMFPYPNINTVYANEPSPQFSDSNVTGMQQTTDTFMMGMHNEADNEPDCIDTNEESEDGKPKVYKVGCQFNDALGKIDELDTNTMEGMVEQFLMLAFAVATVNSLLFKKLQRSRADCKFNNNAQITLRMTQLASLAFILGQIEAKAKMKEAQQLALEKKFAFNSDVKRIDESSKDKTLHDDGEGNKKTIAQMAREQNNKQLDAYMALAEVYKAKIQSLEFKLGVTNTTIAGYYGAMATETLLVMGEKLMCKMTKKKSDVLHSTHLKKIPAILKPILYAQAAKWAAVPEPTATTKAAAIACKAVAAYVPAFPAKLQSFKLKREGQAAKLNTVIKQNAVKEEVGFFKHIGNILKSFVGKAVYPTVNKFDDGLIKVIEESINYDTQRKAASKGELAGYKAYCASMLKCPGPGGIKAKAKCLGLKAKYATLMNKPIKCCGAYTLEGVNGWSIAPRPSVMQNQYDIRIQNMFPPKAATNFIKPAILNILEDYFFKVKLPKLQSKSPKDKLLAIAEFYEYSNYIEHNFETEVMNHPMAKMFDKELAENKDNLSMEFFLKKLASVKEMIIQEAHAETAFKLKNLKLGDLFKVLGFGMLMMKLTKEFGNFLRWQAFPKPKSRIISFGIFGTSLTSVLMYTKKRYDDTSKQRRIILEEASRFANSLGIKSTFGNEIPDLNGPGGDGGPGAGGGGDGNGGSPYNRPNNGEIACATPNSSGGFSPAVCPANVTGAQRVPNIPRVEGGPQVPDLLASFPGMLNNSVLGAAAGRSAAGSKTKGGNLGSVGKNRAAIRKLADKLLDDYEAMEKLENGDKKSGSIRAAIDRYQGMLNSAGGTNNNQSTAGMILNAASEENKKGAKKKEKTKSALTETKVAAVRKAGPPKKEGEDLDFEFDEDVEKVEEELNKLEEDLSNYQVEESAIIDKPDVSIFKVISNRYLMSYPVLLEENNKKKPQKVKE